MDDEKWPIIILIIFILGFFIFGEFVLKYC